MMTMALHPANDGDLHATRRNFVGGKLYCNCKEDPVAVKLGEGARHDRQCRCTQCRMDVQWFPMDAIVSRDQLVVLNGHDKLGVSDSQAAIHRYVCNRCDTEMYGRIDNRNHPFYGLDFINAELLSEGGRAEPPFADFVSSVIETAAYPDAIGDVRAYLAEIGLPYYYCLSSVLVDAVTSYRAGLRIFKKKA